MRKDKLDATGLTLLLGVQLLLALNQISIKVVNEGLQPVFFAGIRSVLAVFVVWAWLWFRGRPPKLTREALWPGIAIGVIFAVEFLFLFVALDLTTVGRASVLMYSMPLWFALMAHFGLGDRITPMKAIGLALAFAGTAWAILGGAKGGQGSLLGDLCAIGAALGWAGTAFIVRRPVMRAVGPEMQLFWMVLVSAPILLVVAPFYGPLIRDFEPLHLVLVLFQSSVVVAGGFILWLWLMSVYPSGTVAAFSFLTPVLAILLGAVFFSESLSAAILGPGLLVGIGIVLINRSVSAAAKG